MLFLVPSRRFFSGVLSLPTQKSAPHPAWDKTVQFSLPLTLRHRHSNNLFCSKYRISPFFFTLAPWQQSTSHTYSLVHYLHCTFNIFLFQPNACCPPQDKMNTTNVNKWLPKRSLPKRNVPSKLGNSRRGCEIGLEMLYKHRGAFDIICLMEVTWKDASAMCRAAPVFFLQMSGTTKTPRGTLEPCKYTYSHPPNSDTVFLKAFWSPLQK